MFDSFSLSNCINNSFLQSCVCVLLTPAVCLQEKRQGGQPAVQGGEDERRTGDSQVNHNLQRSSVSLTLTSNLKLVVFPLTAWPPTCSSPSQASSIKQVAFTSSTLASCRPPGRERPFLDVVFAFFFCLREAVAGQRERAELGVLGGAAGQSVSQEEEGV